MTFWNILPTARIKIMDNKTTFRKAGIILAYPLAYLYTRLIAEGWIAQTVFVLLFIAWNEIVIRGRREGSSKKSYFWYVILILTSLTSSIGPDEEVSGFGLHLCAVYAVLASNGILFEGKTGSLLPADLFNGFLFKGMGNIFRFFKDLGEALKAPSTEGKKRSKGIIAGIFVVFMMIPVFFIAVALLGSINDDFGALTSDVINKILDFLIIELGEILGRAVIAFPVCLYLYGLVASSAAEDASIVREKGRKLLELKGKFKTIAPYFTLFVSGCFVIIYMIFFVFESEYLFGGLMGRMPEGFSICSYARQGFFELVGIMAINMMIFLVVNTFEKEGNGTVFKVSRGSVIALMAQSVVFSMLSFAKLFMYFYAYGYTPKRMLAMWGAFVLGAAAVMVIVSIGKKKDLSRVWIVLTTVSYIAVCAASGLCQCLFCE